MYLNKVGLYKHKDDEFIAGFESANQAIEQNQFQNYNTGKIIEGGPYARTGTASYRLTGSTSVSNDVIGVSKSLKVYTGDVVNMEVYAKYLAPSATGTGLTGPLLVTAISGAFGAGGGTDAFASINSLFNGGPLIGSAAYPYEDQTAPKAYINYILFDENYVPYDFGYDQVSTAGAMPGGGGGTAERLYLTAKARKPGFLYIYTCTPKLAVNITFFVMLVQI